MGDWKGAGEIGELSLTLAPSIGGTHPAVENTALFVCLANETAFFDETKRPQPAVTSAYRRARGGAVAYLSLRREEPVDFSTQVKPLLNNPIIASPATVG